LFYHSIIANKCSFVKRVSQVFRKLILFSNRWRMCYSRLDSRKQWRRSLEEIELAHLIVDKLEEHQATEIVMLDLCEITPLADYFVICTADSERQARALQEILREELKQEHKTRPLSTEGEPASGWTLLDYNSVVVHIFSKQARAYYRLEELWKAAPVVLKIQ
jgi:ribosome-associated protein